MRPSLSSSISKPVVPIFNYSTLMYSSETSLYSISKFDHQETVVDAAEEKKLAEDVISEVNVIVYLYLSTFGLIALYEHSNLSSFGNYLF